MVLAMLMRKQNPTFVTLAWMQTTAPTCGPPASSFLLDASFASAADFSCMKAFAARFEFAQRPAAILVIQKLKFMSSGTLHLKKLCDQTTIVKRIGSVSTNIALSQDRYGQFNRASGYCSHRPSVTTTTISRRMTSVSKCRLSSRS